MHQLTDAVFGGAAVLVSAFDSGWLSRTGGRYPIIALVVLATIAIIALVVAAAAYGSDPRRRARSADDDSDLFTTTPLPMPQEELARLATQSPHHAFRPFRLPRWVQVGSLVAAVGMTWMVFERLERGDRGREPDADSAQVTTGRLAVGQTSDAEDLSPESLDFSADSAAPFAFRAREWIASDRGCAGRLEVTKSAADPWNLTARVHDGQGQLLDTARASVASLLAGDVVEFRFTRTPCDRIGAWDVQGNRRTP